MIENELQIEQGRGDHTAGEPGVLQQPKTVQDMVDFVVGKILID